MKKKEEKEKDSCSRKEKRGLNKVKYSQGRSDNIYIISKKEDIIVFTVLLKELDDFLNKKK